MLLTCAIAVHSYDGELRDSYVYKFVVLGHK